MNKESFEHYAYKVGRENYKEDKSKLGWNVIAEDNGKIYPKNIFEYNCIFLEELLYAKKHYADDKEKFSEHIRDCLQHEFWSRAEYEVIITTWPPYITKEELERLNKEEVKYRTMIDLEHGYKLDVYTQVMMNWHRFINYVWDNKNLITKKKLGLEK